MNIVKIKDVILGEGIPKICAPLVESGFDSLIREAGRFTTLPVDVAEWRADWYTGILDPGTLDMVMPVLARTLGRIPLLFTFRTQGEGGNLPASAADYRTLLERAICSGSADLVDIELFSDDHTVRDLIKLAHANNVGVILSNHDFTATPDEKELLKRLERMDFLGADIAKIAVMPQSAGDVLTLLSATEKASRTLSCQVISMSMQPYLPYRKRHRKYSWRTRLGRVTGSCGWFPESRAVPPHQSVRAPRPRPQIQRSGRSQRPPRLNG